MNLYIYILPFQEVDTPDLEISEAGIRVPEYECPVNLEQLEALTGATDPNAPSECFGADIYCHVLHYVMTLTR